MELTQQQIDGLYHCIRRVRNSGYNGSEKFGMDRSSIVALQAILRPAFTGKATVSIQERE